MAEEKLFSALKLLHDQKLQLFDFFLLAVQRDTADMRQLRIGAQTPTARVDDIGAYLVRLIKLADRRQNGFQQVGLAGACRSVNRIVTLA